MILMIIMMIKRKRNIKIPKNHYLQKYYHLYNINLTYLYFLFYNKSNKSFVYLFNQFYFFITYKQDIIKYNII